MIAFAQQSNIAPIDQVIHGDCLSVLATLEDNSVDAIVTDPPAGIEFMGRNWDNPDWMGGFQPMELADGRKRQALPAQRKTHGNPQCQTCHKPKYGRKSNPLHCECEVPNFNDEALREMRISHNLGKRDAFIAFMTDVMREALRVLKPGGHALIWALPRTSHWTATALEDAGFEVRDKLYHITGQGFPKSLDIGKAIDRMRNDDVRGVCRFLAAHMGKYRITDIVKSLGFAGNGDHGVSAWFREDHVGPRVPTWEQLLELKSLLGFSDEMDAEVWRLNGRKGKPGDAWYEREVIGKSDALYGRKSGIGQHHDHDSGTTWNGKAEAYDITSPATPEAQHYQGYGTALKPAVEEWILCRKPLSESSIAANVLRYGTGGLNIGATRISHNEPVKTTERTAPRYSGNTMNNGVRGGIQSTVASADPQGRFPSNLILSHSIWCVPKGVKRVRANGPSPLPRVRDTDSQHLIGLAYDSPLSYRDEDGLEEVQDWECAEGCPIAELDRMGSQSKSVRSMRGNHSDIRGNNYGRSNGATVPDSDSLRGYEDTGGPSRYFTQFSPDADDFVPFKYVSKASRAERNKGLLLDSTEIVMIQLSHNSQTGGSQWENADLQVTLQVDTAQSPPKVIGVSGIPQSSASEWNTFLFGNDTTEPFLKGCKFTIVTKTNSITKSKTLSWLTRSLTNASIVDVNSEMENGGNHVETVETSTPSVTIISDKDVSLPGVGHVVAQTLLRISVNASPKHNSIDFGTLKSGGSGKPVNGTGLPLPRANGHPCVKPLQLMRWLCRLITPPDGIVLDPFLGSGSTAVAAIQEGMHFIGIEQDESYCAIARSRIAHAMKEVGKPEPVEEYECSEDCPILQIGRQSGIRSNGGGIRTVDANPGEVYGGKIGRKKAGTKHATYGDTGTAARYFTQLAPDSLWEGVSL